MRILFATAEAAPHFQVGGLGAVSEELPSALCATGMDVRVLMPLWSEARASAPALTVVASDIDHVFGHATVSFNLLTPDSGRTVFIEAPRYFESEHSPYANVTDTSDPAFDRFLFFSSAILAAARALDFVPDVLHLHDWHTAAASALLRCNEHFEDDVAETAVVLTIHNAGFEGLLHPDDWRRAGFREDALQQGKTLIGSDVSLLLAGVHFADQITTVSPTYATEITTDRQGPSFAEKLRSRSEDLTGILNGLNVAEFDPTHDPALAEPFCSDQMAGKAICQSELCQELGLEPSSLPLFGMVGRLTEQKGIDLLLQILPTLLESGSFRLAILGQGETDLEQQLATIAERFPSQVSVPLGFDPSLARRITAASDFVLMPSRFEPCGLNQLIAQRYGAIPVVHLTGGLIDSVLPHSPGNRGCSTGIGFARMTKTSCLLAIRRAISLYNRNQHVQLRQRIMRLDLSWTDAVDAYRRVYESALVARHDRRNEAERLDGIRLEPSAPYIEPLRPIPTHFQQDFIRLMVRDAGTLYAYWEVSGPHGEKVLGSLDPEERDHSTWWIELTDPSANNSRRVDVDAYGKNWFIEVPPNTTWVAELWMQAGDADAISMARSESATTPNAWEGRFE